MEKYEPQKIEKFWQKKWTENKLYEPDLKKAARPFYNLMMFPYPSGEGLHIGHMYAFSGADTFGRYMRLKGFDVFEPMGFDAFGIHSENYAIDIGKHPKELIKETTNRYQQQLKRAGFGLDWAHEVKTTDPEYYKWTQWLFLQLYKAGLAERKKAPVNWCPSCKTVLADEQVIAGHCERCESPVQQKELKQWFLKITKYAEKLDKNLDKIDWSENVKRLQRNWIGRSEGATIKFKVKSLKFIEVFTTRPDTLFGATFMVLAPEHPFVASLLKIKNQKSKIKMKIQNVKRIKDYVENSRQRTEEERVEKEKTGVDTGLKAINPATGKEIPIWVADFVLYHYGGGAVMGVPAHDQRDFEFAKKYNLPIIEVVQPVGGATSDYSSRCRTSGNQGQAYEGEGVLVNSDKFNGVASEKAREEISKWLAKKGLAKKAVTYRLRDWLISRQRYWGPPIPIIYCDKCGEVPVPEKDLPVLLPEVKDFRPTGTEKSPLAAISDFVNTKCPECKGLAKRETDVSDNFLDSAWYFLRYPSVSLPGSGQAPFDKEITKKWLPVDMYIGGPEHAVLHLMYTRFMTMALHDLGYLDFEEPFKKFRAHGLITKGGAKMSKSRGNVVNPDEYIEKYGADVLRMYLLFLGPFSQGGDFSDKGISGIVRFLGRVWSLMQNAKCKNQNDKSKCKKNLEIERKLHQTIKKVTEDIEHLRFNTAIAALMTYTNELEKLLTSGVNRLDLVKPLVLLLAPFAPHLSEELWQKLKALNTRYKIQDTRYKSVFQEQWPKYNPKLIAENAFTLIVQINGKVRDQIEAPVGISEKQAKELALKSSKIQKWLEGKRIKKMIYIKNKLINFVLE